MIQFSLAGMREDRKVFAPLRFEVSIRANLENKQKLNEALG